LTRDRIDQTLSTPDGDILEELAVRLTDPAKVIRVGVKSMQSAVEVYNAVADAVRLTEDSRSFFCLFEIMQDGFGSCWL
jgi:hypothetical protein